MFNRQSAVTNTGFGSFTKLEMKDWWVGAWDCRLHGLFTGLFVSLRNLKLKAA